MKIEEAIEKLNDDVKESLQNCSSIEEMIDTFKNNGIDISKEMIEAALSNKSGELSDDELENVNGGMNITFFIQEALKFGIRKFKENQADKNNDFLNNESNNKRIMDMKDPNKGNFM